MKISVVLSLYNEEKYCSKAIESVLNQSLTDFELIIINDGSTDNTYNIINKYSYDTRVKIVNQKNIGLGASRNKAIDMSNGEYIMFLDGDDWYDANALKECYNETKSKNTDITFFQMINYNNGKLYENDWFNLNSFDSSFDNKVFTPNDTKDFLFDLSVSACQKIYNANFLKESDVRFPEGIFFEDMPFFFEIYLKADRISIIRKHFYYRRKHSKSITHIVDCNYLDTVKAGQELFKRFVENDFYDMYKFDLIAYKINGPRLALRDIEEKCKVKLFELIKKDYTQVKQSQYYDDFLENLGPIKRKFFLDVLKANDYEEFLKSN